MQVKYALVDKFVRNKSSMEVIRKFINTNRVLQSPPIVGMMDRKHVLLQMGSAEDVAKAWSLEGTEIEGVLLGY